MVSRGSCVFCLVYAALIAMMEIADGGPITMAAGPFLSLMPAFWMVNQARPHEEE